MRHRAGIHRLTLLDRLRGWHWRDGNRYHNWCGCPKEAS